MQMHRATVRIIGIGNEFRSDDGVGLLVARQLRARLPREVVVLEESGEGTALIEAWQGADTVLLIDAVQSGAAPGVIHLFEAHRRALPDQMFCCSSHSFGVAQAIEMARELGRLPRTLIVHGIEARQFNAGTALSPEVEAAAEQVEDRILRWIRAQ
jgi:hydrogenase maturation protease